MKILRDSNNGVPFLMQKGETMAIYTGRNEDSSGNILLSIGNGMTATLETGTTASQAYTKGAYVFFDNKLCKATTAIVSGDTLAIGTNLVQTSVGTELTSHLRSSDDKEFYFDVSDGKYGFYPSASKVASEFVPFGGTVEIPSSITITGYCDGFSVRATAPAALCDLYNTLQFSQSGGTQASLIAGNTTIGSVGTYNLANYRGRNMTGFVLWLQDDHGPMSVYLTLSNPIS